MSKWFKIEPVAPAETAPSRNAGKEKPSNSEIDGKALRSLSEVADIMGISKSHVQELERRALRKLKRHFEKQGLCADDLLTTASEEKPWWLEVRK